MKSTTKVDFRTLFDNGAIVNISGGGLPKMVTVMDTMFQDTFLYCIPGSQHTGRDFDYNFLSFEERYNILYMYTEISSLLKILMRYEFTHYLQDEILIDADTANEINNIFSFLTGFVSIDNMCILLEQMMITSVVEKFVYENGDAPSYQERDIYFFYTMIRGIMKGYLGAKSDLEKIIAMKDNQIRTYEAKIRQLEKAA